MNTHKVQAGLMAMGVCWFGAGCVSSSKYKKLEAEKMTLESRVSSLEKDKADLSSQKEDLSRQKEDLTKTNAKTEEAYNAILLQMADEVEKGDLKVTQYKNMMSVDVADKIFFASGSATLKPEGQDVLKKLAKTLNNFPDKVIRVVGHTDNVPLSKTTRERFPSNWELSVSRSTIVVRFLQQNGIDPNRLIASGRSEFSPVSPNTTEEGRQKNRRIEIMLIDKKLIETLELRK